MQTANKIFAIIAFCFLWVFAGMLLDRPKIAGYTMMQTMAVCLGVGVFLGRRYIWRRPSRLLLLALVAGLIAIPFAVIIRVFGRFDVLALVFHTQFGVTGTTLSGFEFEIMEGVGAVSAILFAGFALGSLLRWPRLLAVITAVLLVVLNPLARFGLEYASATEVESDLHLSLRPLETDVQPDLLPNIVVVYLEGLERAYMNEARYGDLYAPLNRYAAQGVSFTQVRQVRGTGWSLAGLATTQCGVPLLPNGLRQRYGFHEQIDFLGGHTCLGDFTDGMGYQNAFLLGGPQAFGGMNHFFRTHKMHDVIDYDVLKDSYPPAVFTDARSGPKLDDALLFDASTKTYDRMVQDDAPFLMMVLTYGPHGNTALLSGNCTDSGRAEVAFDVPIAIECTLKNMEPFLQHISDNRNGRPTVVMLASDHLNHDTEIRQSIPVTERANTVIMYGLGFDQPLAPPGTIINRPGSMLDVFPTLLAYAGLADKEIAAGMGRSLFGQTPTLVEEKGHVRLDAELFPNPLLNATIWTQRDEALAGAGAQP